MEKFNNLEGLFDKNLFCKELQNDLSTSKEKKVKTSKKQKEVDPKNLVNLNSRDIKDLEWQEVKRAKKLNDQKNVIDHRSIFPSRNGEVDFHEGNNILSGQMNSIFNPKISIKKYENDLSESVIKDAEQKRAEKISKKNRSARDEWEVVSKAKTTADADPASMGFTPVRSNLEYAELPEIKISNVDRLKKESLENFLQGKKAADLKMEQDKQALKEFKKSMNEKWDWEKEAENEISKKVNQNVEKQEVFQFAEDFITTKENGIITSDFEKLFNRKEKIIEAKDLKQDLKIRSKRKTRKSDRSWERVSLPKKYGKF